MLTKRRRLRAQSIRATRRQEERHSARRWPVPQHEPAVTRDAAVRPAEQRDNPVRHAPDRKHRYQVDSGQDASPDRQPSCTHLHAPHYNALGPSAWA